MKKILVIVRETFPTNMILSDKNIQENFILNPYDEYALFQAKKLKEKLGIEICCIFLSHRESQYNLRTALALGVDEGIFLYCSDNNIKKIAKELASEIRKENYSSIFVGIRDVNDDREELPGYLSIFLDIPLYPHILSLDYENEKFIVRREREETIDTLEINKVGIFAFSQNVYEPEYPSISSIISIKDKKIKTISCETSFQEEGKKIFYQDIRRKQKILKKINANLGTNEILEYLKTWKLLD
ncbi:electron transfer flavoprotein [Fusobacterium simiae]|uniref:electron transfer flavoprotein n=1 Tax=Fusobacterium TaxID=848 RepID=UPI000407DF4A|nr:MULTISPECIES: electron transfer flavoprotein [Fusobacterium]MDC7956336.1 electron transfer flavoprotein [Fusobacterium simiae]